MTEKNVDWDVKQQNKLIMIVITQLKLMYVKKVLI